MQRLKLASVALLAILGTAAWASPPKFTGNGAGIRMQGGTAGKSFYITSGWAWGSGPWQGYCNQAITDAAGAFLGWYIDDSVNYYAGPPASTIAPVVTRNQDWKNEANCVAWDRQSYPGAIIIAALPPGRPDWTFTKWGANYNALEWYPYCGARNLFGPPPKKNAYILQYNFVWSKTNGGGRNCPPTPRSKIRALQKQVEGLTPRPKMIFYY